MSNSECKDSEDILWKNSRSSNLRRWKETRFEGKGKTKKSNSLIIGNRKERRWPMKSKIISISCVMEEIVHT